MPTYTGSRFESRDSFKEETLNHSSQSCTVDGLAALSLHDNGSVQLIQVQFSSYIYFSR